MLLVTHLWRTARLIFIGLFLLLSSASFAAPAPDITVTAELSRHRVAAGDMVQLDIKVTGAQQADLPREIAADGLQIRLSGQSSEVQMVNFNVTSSVLYSYIVIPLQTGIFTIPSLQVRAEGKYFRTPPQQLTVVGSAPAAPASRTPAAAPLPPIGTTTFSAPPTQQRPASSATGGDQIAFGELTVAKKKIYVGEVVPAEIRFYVNAHYNAELRGGVNFGGEGFLVDRLNEPQRNVVERSGTPYNMLSFRTLISAVKPGPLDVGPATFDMVIEMPGAAPAGMPDVVAQLLGRSGSMRQQHPVTLKSNKVSLEVIPLPKEGRPDDFSGAIGEFYLDAMALPQKYAMGDPVTLALTIEGKGNFSAMKAPQLTEAEGWRIYPPTDRFETTDALISRGVKTFETTMMAQQPESKTPGSAFSYFNPTTAKYVTLTTKPIPLGVISQASSTNAASAATNAVSAAASPTAPASEGGTKDQPLTHFSTHSWKAPLYRVELVIAWSALFLAALLFALYLGLRDYQRRGGSLRHQAELKFQKLAAELRQEELDGMAFYNKAADYSALLIKEDASRKEELQGILERRDELNYGARETHLRCQERQKVLEKLFSFHTSSSNKKQ